MARRLGLLNPALTGSTISLDRRSNTSINAIDNVSFDDEASNSTYNTLQLNNPQSVNSLPQQGQNPLYDVVGADVGTRYRSRTSQTSKKPGRIKQRKRERMIRAILMFLIVSVAIVAMLLAFMLMMGNIEPKCSCTSSDPRAEKSSQQRNTTEPDSQSTFNMDLSPFYDILEDLKANISSLHKEAETLMMESEGNKDALVETKTKLNNTEDAIDLFYNQLYSAINHVNSTAGLFDPDNSLAFSRLGAVNATIISKLTEMKRTYDRYNDDIDNAIVAMNGTIAQKVAIKKLDSGPIGERGWNGSKGSLGDRGSTGPKGENGTTGPKGPKGEKGATGESGFPGTTGAKGPKGDKGSQGPKGDNGTIGQVGEKGVPGPRGIGNFSWCQQKVKTEENRGTVTVRDSSNTKITGAYCTTDQKGTEANLEGTPSVSSANEYRCQCRGDLSTITTAKCIMHYMECPIRAP